MNRLDNLNKFFLEKERNKLQALAKENLGGLPTMSVSILILFMYILVNNQFYDFGNNIMLLLFLL